MTISRQNGNGQATTAARHELRTFVAYVENLPGVLNRVSSLFRRRAYNIDSLAVGRTETPGISRMTIVMEGDETIARLVEANLYKLVNVLKVEDVTHEQTIDRDLAMIKVKADAEVRPQVMQISEVFRARIVDVTPESLVMEITGTEDKLQGLVDVLMPFGILEMVRTGTISMKRGSTGLTFDPRFVPASVEGD